MTFLVIGATGSVGRAVLDRLVGDGREVRATSRDPSRAALPTGVEVVAADLGEPATLLPALDGVEAVFLYAGRGDIDGVARTLASAGPPRVVLLSSSSALRAGAEDDAIGRPPLLAERALTRSDLPCTFLRPGAFATNALQWAGAIRAGRPVPLPYPDSRSAPIHEADIADVAVAALTDDRLVGRHPVISGPQSLSFADMVAILAEAIGLPLTFESVDPDQFRRDTAADAPPGVIDAQLRFWVAHDGRDVPVSGETEAITGHAGRPFARWATEHAADFR